MRLSRAGFGKRSMYVHQALRLFKIDTDDNVADMFTKQLAGNKQQFFSGLSLGIGKHGRLQDFIS